MDLHKEQDDKKIDCTTWDTLSLHKLYEQKNILSNRLMICLATDRSQMSNQMQFGLQELDRLIELKLKENSKSNRTIIT